MTLLQESNIKEGILTIGGLILVVLVVNSCSAYMEKKDEESKEAYAQEYLEEHAFEYVEENRYMDMVDLVYHNEGSYEDGYADGYSDGYDDGVSE